MAENSEKNPFAVPPDFGEPIPDPRDTAEDRPRKGAIEIELENGKGLAACDIGGKSDPYYVLTIESESGDILFQDKSEVQKKTLNPVWARKYKHEINDDFKGTLLRIALFDKDVVGKDDFMGEVRIPLDSHFWKTDAKWTLYTMKEYKLKGRKGKKDSHVTGSLTLALTWQSEFMKEAVKKYLNEANERNRKESAWRQEKEKYLKAKDFPDLPLFEAVLDDQVDKVREYLAQGMSPDAKSEFNDTRAIHVAIRRGITEMVRMLVDAGANLTYLDNDRKNVISLYHVASVKGDHQAWRELWTEHPRLKPLIDAHNNARIEAARERKIKEMEDKKYKYCLATGKTGYEDDFPNHLFEVKE